MRKYFLTVGTVLVVTIFFYDIAVAEQSGLCENLHVFSCSPGKQDDGTGNESIDKDDHVVDEAVDGKTDLIKSSFLKVIQDPKNGDFKKLSLSAFGLTNSPQCQSQKSADMEKCDSDIVDGLTDLAKVQLDSIHDARDFTSKSDPDLQRSLEAKALVSSNAAFKQVSATIADQINKDTKNPEVAKKIENKIFPRIQALLIKKISKLPINEKQKNYMMEKIKIIKYKNDNCQSLTTDIGANFVPNAFYNPADNTFTVCKGFLRNNISEFKISTVIGHELAHSIDPCNIVGGSGDEGVHYKNTNDLVKMQQEYPLKDFIECLRTNKSVNATNFVANPEAAKKVFGNWVTVGPRPSATTQYSFCKDDQITESVADWFGSEVMTEYIKQNFPNLTAEQWQIGASNIYRASCSSTPIQGDPHPAARLRINAILLQNPKLRKEMGCTKPHSQYVYCDASHPGTMKKIIEEDQKDSKGAAVTPPSRSTAPVNDESKGGAQ